MNDTLAPLKWLLGEWHGQADGIPGSGHQLRRYELVLRGEFIMGTNRTVWAPKPGQTEAEVHEDLSFISYDRAAGHFVMHVFYVERFVAEYVSSPQREPDEWVFTAARVQNGPAGMRARETIARRGEQFDARFELAMAGKDFELYTHETLVRGRDSELA